MSAQTTTSQYAAPIAGSDGGQRRRWWILAVLGIAQLMVVLDATVVNIALPSAQKALHFSNGNRQWIITAYALAFGSLLLLGGRIGDLFGRKRTFVGGASGFAPAAAVGVKRGQAADRRAGHVDRDRRSVCAGVRPGQCPDPRLGLLSDGGLPRRRGAAACDVRRDPG